ncbi:MAG TPA: hypothetical protein VG754_04300 [Verrucomicrobiae bacterium]|jgi:hypothetical protein|nr:hypothetical protein [Verrucomicrobiae bacterium]
MSGINAYSHLTTVLNVRKIAIPELRRQMLKLGVPVNIKSLYRLASPEPLQKIDLRILGAICRTCHVGIQEVIDFNKPSMALQRLGSSDQKRLDELMSGNNDGMLDSAERKELEELAGKAHQITIANARLLARQRRTNRSHAAGLRNRHRRKLRHAA